MPQIQQTHSNSTVKQFVLSCASKIQSLKLSNTSNEINININFNLFNFVVSFVNRYDIRIPDGIVNDVYPSMIWSHRVGHQDTCLPLLLFTLLALSLASKAPMASLELSTYFCSIKQYLYQLMTRVLYSQKVAHCTELTIDTRKPLVSLVLVGNPFILKSNMFNNQLLTYICLFLIFFKYRVMTIVSELQHGTRDTRTLLVDCCDNIYIYIRYWTTFRDTT